jgi:hypothetical protein
MDLKGEAIPDSRRAAFTGESGVCQANQIGAHNRHGFIFLPVRQAGEDQQASTLDLAILSGHGIIRLPDSCLPFHVSLRALHSLAPEHFIIP